MSQLALTMIVRNEEQQLPTFLAHHRNLVDEIIIVDTGSGDRSVEIACAAGATVCQQRWVDDFAMARNQGLAAAKSTWALILDADERISPCDFAVLRAAAEGPADRVYLQETWNYCQGSSHLEWEPLVGRYPAEEAGQTGMFRARRVGLFPVLSGLIFSGRVHESVLPAAEALGLPVIALDVPVHHYGYVGSAENNARRQARYRRLVELKYADDEADPAAQLEMATVLLENGESAAAIVHLQRLVGGPIGLRPVVRGLVLLGRLRREMGEVETARKLLTEAIGQDPEFRFAWLERIRVETQAGDWNAAEALLKRADALFGPQEPRFLKESLLIKVKTGQLQQALSAGEDLVRFFPQWREIRDLTERLRQMVWPSGER